jgi:hypothetical protein
MGEEEKGLSIPGLERPNGVSASGHATYLARAGVSITYGH